jgi:hypothetical protein
MGVAGASGTSGTSGSTGTSGSSGSSGTSGSAGTSGTSGISGNVGSSGTYITITGTAPIDISPNNPHTLNSDFTVSMTGVTYDSGTGTYSFDGNIVSSGSYLDFIDLGSVINSYASVTTANGVIISNGVLNASVITSPSATNEAMFVDYVITDSARSNKRAGNIRLVYNNSQVLLDETSTVDIGDTTDFIFTAAINGSNVELRASNATGQNMIVIYEVKYLYIV